MKFRIINTYKEIFINKCKKNKYVKKIYKREKMCCENCSVNGGKLSRTFSSFRVMFHIGKSTRKMYMKGLRI